MGTAGIVVSVTAVLGIVAVIVVIFIVHIALLVGHHGFIFTAVVPAISSKPE